MYKVRWPLPLFIFWIITISPWLAAADGDYTIRSNPQEVRVVFTAVDAQGRSVTQLGEKEIAVVDNGEVIRHFRSFGDFSDIPINLVILIDVSDSVAKEAADEVQLVKGFIAGNAWKPSDDITVEEFAGTRAHVICSRNCREFAVTSHQPDTGNTTPLYDSLVTASELIGGTRKGESKSAIVLLSDGDDNVSLHSLADAITAAQSQEAAVYTVNLRAKHADAHGIAVLERIARETGGRAYLPGREVEATMRAILNDLRHGFVLTYDLPHTELPKHEVRVVPATNPQLRLRSRLSYTAAPTSTE